MFCFTVTELGLSEGIPVVEREGEPVVEISTVGAPGPLGRVPVFLPFFFRAGKPQRITRCSIQPRALRGRPFLIDPSGKDDDHALLLCRFPIPKDGLGVYWSGVDPIHVACPMRHRSDTAKGTCPRCNVALTVSGYHPGEGYSFHWPVFPHKGITVLAERETKFYLDSALSDYPERLVVMSPGSVFRVTLVSLDDMAASKGDGGLNFVSAFRRYFLWTGTELKVGSFQEVFPHIEVHSWEHDQL